MLTGYWTMSGIEVANASRVSVYAAAGLAGGLQTWPGCDCPAIVPFLTDPGPYTLPDTVGFEAPWLDPERPESAQFGGILVNSVVGLDDPYVQRDVGNAIIGGSLGGLRLGPRTITITVTLLGLSTISLDYGLAWLTSVLDSKFCNATTFCTLGDLSFFAGCPDPVQGADCPPGVTVVDETALDLARTMHSGGLVSGPRVTNRHLRGNEVVAYEVVFTLAMESPYMAGTTEAFVTATDLTANPSVPTEVFTCPAFVDPCAGIPPASDPLTGCATFVEDTCDWNNPGESGPPSWLTQTWAPTGEEVINPDPGVPCTMSLTRTGDAGIDGCTRPSVRMQFGDALGGTGPISIEFDIDVAQGNLNFSLWDPGTDTNIPISSFASPSGSNARTFVSPTGNSYNALDATSAGHHQINYALPAGVNPGTLYLIIHAFGGTLLGNPADETVSGIFMNFLGTPPAACCSLEPGDPIVGPTFTVPCYTVPVASHRTIASVTNPDLVTERGFKFAFSNADVAASLTNMRVAMYDPTLIGLAPTALPTVGGVWPLGVQEWECNALVAEFFVPEIPAGETVEVDGCRRRILRYPNGQPADARIGDRFVYGGPEYPYSFQTLPTCATWAVVVFAEDGGTLAGSTVDIGAADLHLVTGAAV